MNKLWIGFFLIAGLTACTGRSQSDQGTRVRIETTLGDITVKLYDETPVHRNNFLKLVHDHVYDSMLFHRVIREFVIQTGDPTSKHTSDTTALGTTDVGYSLPAEIRPALFHKRGALAAAREGDDVNPERRSSGSHFYIVTGKTYTREELAELEDRMNASATPSAAPFRFSEPQIEAYTTIGGVPRLDGSYTVFGEVVEGMDVVRRIEAAPTNDADRPITDIRILKTVLVK